MIPVPMLDNPPKQNVHDNAHDLHERLTAIVRELIEPPPRPDEALPVDRQLSELGVKSLGMLRLVLAIESEFNLLFPQSDLNPENFRCLSSIQRLLERQFPARPAR